MTDLFDEPDYAVLKVGGERQEAIEHLLHECKIQPDVMVKLVGSPEEKQEEVLLNCR